MPQNGTYTPVPTDTSNSGTYSSGIIVQERGQKHCKSQGNRTERGGKKSHNQNRRNSKDIIKQKQSLDGNH